MFTHPFAYVMIATFLAALVTLVLGVAGMSKSQDGTQNPDRSTKLMALRVGLCIALLIEIIIYIAYIK